jgi:RNA polymerase sigma-70 factor, ECF subfamily
MPQAIGNKPSANRITELLGEWRAGDERALAELVPLVYGELRRLARHYLNRESKRPTLETRDLIHDAFVRLCDLQEVDWQSRAHFFSIAARIMRRILIDRARRRQFAKHGGRAVALGLQDIPDLAIERDADLLALDDALAELAELDETLARIVELRFFGGLDHDEVAVVLGVSNPTVRRHWRLAKTWLRSRLTTAETRALHGGG